MTHVFLQLGSNIEDRLANLDEAIEELKKLDITIVNESSNYDSEPWGKEDQATFLNKSIEIKTDLEPVELLTTLKSIETKMGRTKTEKFGPRKIDLDILYYGNQVIDSDHLTLPHPLLRERNFVLTPLDEIASDFEDPIDSLTIQTLKSICPDKKRVWIHQT